MKKALVITGIVPYFLVECACANSSKDELAPPEAQPVKISRIVVSLADQAFAAYEGDQPVIRGPISSGTDSHKTPTGSYRVTNKHRDWVSTIYDVPMPHFLRLNHGAVGLHGGYLPGVPASHGCVRLPYEVAENLFAITSIGVKVNITAESTPDTQGIPQPPRKITYYRVVDGEKVILSDSEVARIEEFRKRRSSTSWVGTKHRGR